MRVKDHVALRLEKYTEDWGDRDPDYDPFDSSGREIIVGVPVQQNCGASHARKSSLRSVHWLRSSFPGLWQSASGSLSSCNDFLHFEVSWTEITLKQAYFLRSPVLPAGSWWKTSVPGSKADRSTNTSLGSPSSPGTTKNGVDICVSRSASSQWGSGISARSCSDSNSK